MQQPKQMLHKPLPDQEIPNFNLTKYFASNFYLPFVSSTTTGETFFFPRLVGVFTHGGGFRIAATVCTLVWLTFIWFTPNLLNLSSSRSCLSSLLSSTFSCSFSVNVNFSAELFLWIGDIGLSGMLKGSSRHSQGTLIQRVTSLLVVWSMGRKCLVTIDFEPDSWVRRVFSWSGL